MMEALHRALGPMRRRIQGMVARGVVEMVDDTAQVQTLQLSVLADETHEGVERFQNYGFSSVPFGEAEATVVYIGGLRSHGIVLAVEDRRYRMKGGEDGEVVVYDDLGQAVHLKRDRILITSPNRVQVEAPKVVVLSDDVSLGAEGGAKVARVGDTVVGGVITSGSNKVKAA